MITSAVSTFEINTTYEIHSAINRTISIEKQEEIFFFFYKFIVEIHVISVAKENNRTLTMKRKNEILNRENILVSLV